MIELLESADTPERRAAERVRDALVQVWPDLPSSPADQVKIAANCKIFGYDVQDFDVIAIAHFAEGKLLQPLRPVRCQQEGVVARRDIVVKSFGLVIEVKSHDSHGVRFEGAVARVRYSNGAGAGWHDASQQSLRQAHALRSYLSHFTNGHFFVANLVYFDNLEEADLPARPHNMIAVRFSGRSLLTALAEVAKPWAPDGSRPIVSAGKSDSVPRALGAPIFRKLEPTAIDRRRMDRISRRLGLREEWFAEMGARQLVLRGRGGTGKTVGLLQLAHRAFEARGARTLILTYNLALLADMRRTMALLGISSGVEHGGIVVESVMSHVGKILRLFGVLPPEEDFLEQYEGACANLAAQLANGALPQSEIAELMRADPERFAFDFVMVDEGQDWPLAEINIIRSCYPPTSIVVADGVDQIVRGARAAWTVGVPASSQRVWPLSNCLRLKRNVAIFANALAARLGLTDWRVEPSDEIRGGRVIVVEGRLANAQSVHRRVLDDSAKDGNSLVDALYCVPPSLAKAAADGRQSIVANWLAGEGIQAWDGTRRDVRRDIPRSVDEVRLVQYESCRGLEGWTVFCLGFPEFWQHRHSVAMSEELPQHDGSLSREAAASQSAARWAMMPMTRAMDTLVIELADCPKSLWAVFDGVRSQLPDAVGWLSV